MRTERLQTLADGIFAIALTLLVLSLPVPKGSRRLAHDLLAQWPFYAAYVVSFVTVAIVWINHHALMDGVVRADRTLMELNLLLMLFVALVPWPTGLLAEYLRDGGSSGAAAVTYGIVMMLMAASFTGIWLWLARTEDLAHPEMRPRIPLAIRRSSVGPVVYLAGTLLALASAPFSFALYAAAAAFFALSGRTARLPSNSEIGVSS
jgi:TMEM175 potassium channel family protein